MIRVDGRYMKRLGVQTFGHRHARCAIVITGNHDDWYFGPASERAEKFIEQRDRVGWWDRSIKYIAGQNDCRYGLRGGQHKVCHLLEGMSLLFE